MQGLWIKRDLIPVTLPIPNQVHLHDQFCCHSGALFLSLHDFT